MVSCGGFGAKDHGGMVSLGLSLWWLWCLVGLLSGSSGFAWWFQWWHCDVVGGGCVVDGWVEFLC